MMKYMDILIKSLENLAIKFYYHYEEERKNLLKIVKGEKNDNLSNK